MIMRQPLKKTIASLKLASICILTIILQQTSSALAQTAAVVAIGDRDIADRVDAALAKNYPANKPGATVIVAKDGTTLFRKAYGMADIAKQLPLSVECRCELAR